MRTHCNDNCPTDRNCQAPKVTASRVSYCVQVIHTSHTLARSSILIEGETRVARTGIGSRNICTELLAVTIATFVNVWKQMQAMSGLLPEATISMVPLPSSSRMGQERAVKGGDC